MRGRLFCDDFPNKVSKFNAERKKERKKERNLKKKRRVDKNALTGKKKLNIKLCMIRSQCSMAYKSSLVIERQSHSSREIRGFIPFPVVLVRK